MNDFTLFTFKLYTFYTWLMNKFGYSTKTVENEILAI